MATVGKLVAILTAQTAPFEKGMKRASGRVSAFSGLVKTAGASLAAYFGARQLIGMAQESMQLFGRQEQAVQMVSAAIRMIGAEANYSVPEARKFASEIQRITTYGDEAVLELMAMGASMGRLSGRELEDATKAAIGLSQAYGIELVGAMRLVARAAIGDTSSLTRYGIKLDETLTSQEKFNEVLRRGAEAFVLAGAEAQTATGRMTQFRNIVGDIKEEIGEGYAQTIALVNETAQLAGFGSDFHKWWARANMELSKFLLGITFAETVMSQITAKDEKQVDAAALARAEAQQRQAAADVLGDAVPGDGGFFSKFLQTEGKRYYDETRTAAEQYRAELANLDLLFRHGAISTDTWVRSMTRARKALEEADGTIAKRNKAMDEHNALLAEGQSIMESLATAEEQHALEIANLNKLVKAGALDWQYYLRAVLDANAELEKATKKQLPVWSWKREAPGKGLQVAEVQSLKYLNLSAQAKASPGTDKRDRDFEALKKLLGEIGQAINILPTKAFSLTWN